MHRARRDQPTPRGRTRFRDSRSPAITRCGMHRAEQEPDTEHLSQRWGLGVVAVATKPTQQPGSQPRAPAWASRAVPRSARRRDGQHTTRAADTDHSGRAQRGGRDGVRAHRTQPPALLAVWDREGVCHPVPGRLRPAYPSRHRAPRSHEGIGISQLGHVMPPVNSGDPPEWGGRGSWDGTRQDRRPSGSSAASP
jgi:hypothetical protein